jgi:ubiquitin-like 1-activating enzyme E1 B
MAAEVVGVFKPSLKELVIGSKILVVGAGGIGCEVLKNLVMCGFKDIEIVSIFFRESLQKQQQFSFRLI